MPSLIYSMQKAALCKKSSSLDDDDDDDDDEGCQTGAVQKWLQ